MPFVALQKLLLYFGVIFVYFMGWNNPVSIGLCSFFFIHWFCFRAATKSICKSWKWNLIYVCAAGDVFDWKSFLKFIIWFVCHSFAPYELLCSISCYYVSLIYMCFNYVGIGMYIYIQFSHFLILQHGYLHKRTSDNNKWQMRWFLLYQVIKYWSWWYN